MRSTILAFFIVPIAAILLCSTSAAQDEGDRPENVLTPARQIELIIEEYDDAWRAYIDSFASGKKEGASRQKPNDEVYGRKLWEIVRQHRKAPGITKGLVWMVRHEDDRALEILKKDHPKSAALAEALLFNAEFGSPEQQKEAFLIIRRDYTDSDHMAKALLVRFKNGQPEQKRESIEELMCDYLDSIVLKDLCLWLTGSVSEEHERLMRKLMEESPHREVRGHACYSLGRILKAEAALAYDLQTPDGPETSLYMYSKFYGEKMIEKLRVADHEKLAYEGRRLFKQVVKEFSDVETSRRAAGSTLGELAAANLFEMENLATGKKAPEIEGEDLDGVSFKLSDYLGKIVVLNFWGDW